MFLPLSVMFGADNFGPVNNTSNLPLTCTWSSSMPAVTMPSPASRYEGSTWRQITLDDSLEEIWSFTSSILSGQLLGLRFIAANFLCSFEPKCCQLKEPNTVCLSVNLPCPVYLHGHMRSGTNAIISNIYLITDDNSGLFYGF